ncbi:MAG: putative pyridoxal phosphate enzyme YggS family [Clostridiaceae bacterium]|jgi:pyridoxal phosphate enzyme (YggS family)|nr:putative pyridoxal phosphate enzyme YggS family [Clostridiaceae bacterium]
MKENIQLIYEKIRKIAKENNRNSEDITLIAVSKTYPTDKIFEAYKFGVTNFGENKEQELSVKTKELYDIKSIQWHFIGHLQCNKVKKIIDKVALIHTVDSIKLATEIQKQAEQREIICNILIQINISQEETKFGINKEELINMIEKIKNYKNIRIQGLMTIAPNTEDKEVIKKVFRETKCLYDSIQSKYGNSYNIDFKYLSMGMSKDFSLAIEEGANMVRIGSAIFGERNYNRKEDI